MLPEEFQKGVAISIWQNAPDRQSNWGSFCRGKKFGWFPNVLDKSDPNKQSDFWNNYKVDLDNTKALGCNAFRFSFEWSRIEPERGHIDQAALARYHDMLAYMKQIGLEPNATIHHFTHPCWFDKIGGFEKEENIEIFVNFATTLFQEFKSEITVWCTFNEPSIYSFSGFVLGVHSPGHMFKVKRCGKTLLNMLRAHTKTYRAFKQLPGGSESSIGIAHHCTYAISYSDSCIYALAKWMSKNLTHWIGWDIVPKYFMTGEFEWKIPLVMLGGGFKYKEEGVWDEPPLDWFGVNYYSRGLSGCFLNPIVLPGEIQTDMGYVMYPQGLYESIEKVSEIGCPIYISETGVPDKQDTMRELCINTYLEIVWKAINKGFDVRGFYFWTLVDNFEWQSGFSARFGLYQWEPDGSVDRKLREGAKALRKIYNEIPDNFEQLKTWLQQHKYGQEENEEKDSIQQYRLEEEETEKAMLVGAAT